MGLFSKSNKNIKVAISSKDDKDDYNAAVLAAKENIESMKVNPEFSIAYISCGVDPLKIIKGLNEVLGADKWVGVSSDRAFNNKDGFNNNKLSLCSFDSANIHFNVSVAENYRKDPKTSAIKATRDALKKAKSDKLDNFVQYTRLQKKGFEDIVKDSPYFIITYVCGSKIVKGKTIPGFENDFLSGIIEAAGSNVPVFGGSASPDFFNYIEGKDNNNFVCANGKYYDNAALVIFVTTNLKFKIQVEHGFDLSSDFVIINELDKTGYKILKMNNNDPVKEYARILKVDEKKFLADPSSYSFPRPFGLVGIDSKTYIKEPLINVKEKSISSPYKLNQNTVLNVLNYNEKKTFNTIPQVLTEAKSSGRPAVNLIASCCSRRLVLKDREKEEISNVNKKFKDVNMYGFFSFSEIGSTKTSQAQVHSFTVTCLTIYDELLTD